ncbi:gamma-butyrobetaine hydroxylase-like domain-containing protein [Marinobacter sp. DSM 26671]|nr:gamma-butyrobetaine hydroxylase-like domain-containing protein [Marinobacter sp. DSM 26671]
MGRLSLIDADISIKKVELSGVSGLQFFFSDGHYRGLYPWGFLRELSEQVS